MCSIERKGTKQSAAAAAGDLLLPVGIGGDADYALV